VRRESWRNRKSDVNRDPQNDDYEAVRLRSGDRLTDFAGRAREWRAFSAQN